jgi:hypothetical protein
MPYDKYGLDWNVGGGNKTPSQQKESDFPFFSSIPERPRTEKKTQEEEPVYEEPIDTTVTLVNPRFFPNNNTAINKECAIAVDILTKEQCGQVTFELLAEFNNKEYHLSRFKIAEHNGTKATTTLLLDCVNEYAIEAEKKQPDPTLHIDYYIRVTARDAKEVTSIKLTLPYIDPLAEQMQKCAAEANVEAVNSGSGMVSTCSECAKFPKEKGDEPTNEQSMQCESATTITEAAKDGSPMVNNCVTCKDRGKCGMDR